MLQSLHLEHCKSYVDWYRSDHFTEQERNVAESEGSEPRDPVWEGTGEGPLRGVRTQHLRERNGLFITFVPAASHQIDQSSSISPVPGTGVVPSPIVEVWQVLHPAIQVIFSSEDMGVPGPSSHHHMISQTNTAAESRNILNT